MSIGLYDYNSPELAYSPEFYSEECCEKCGAITSKLFFDEKHGLLCDYCRDEVRQAREEEEIQREGRRAA